MNLRLFYRSWKARYRDQRHEIRATLSFIQPGNTVVDVGAHKGAYLYWLQKAVGTGGKVFAFEPQPSLFRYLEQITASMKWNNVMLKKCALSDSTGTRKLYVPNENSPGASLETVAGSAHGSSYNCQTDTLDNQLRGAAKITFLKIDVEGHELQIFHGAKQILSQHMPAILFECETRHLQHHTMKDVFTFLEDLGYGGGFFSAQGLRPLAEFDPEIHQKRNSERFWDAPGYCNNFLFVHRTNNHHLDFSKS
jgi:FkbM family methyltransferase